MLTKILVCIIAVLIMINTVMICAVFANGMHNDKVMTIQVGNTETYHQTEIAPIVTTFSSETENEIESGEAISSSAIEASLPGNILETVGCFDNSCGEDSELLVTTESKISASQPVEAANDDNSEIENTEVAVCYDLTYEEKDMLLRIAMAEVGGEDCIECLALVMKTVLNRMESPLFPSTIYRVINAENQFAPVASGTFYTAVPNENCYEALELVISGWDESQGALYFEACVGNSWHSRNLELLFQHCNTRFYR